VDDYPWFILLAQALIKKKRLLWDMIRVASALTHGGFIFVEPVLLHPHIFFSVIVATSHINCQRLYFQSSQQFLSPLTMGPPGPALGFLPTHFVLRAQAPAGFIDSRGVHLRKLY
jgi:hypothetical protein